MRLWAQLCGELVKTVGAAGYQHDLIAAPREDPGELLTDTRRSAGDDGSAVAGWWRESHTVPCLSGVRELREPRELVDRLAQHLGRRRTSLLQPDPVGQGGPVVGVRHVGQRRVDRVQLPTPQVARRLLSGFCWKPGDFAAFDEFHDVVLPHRTVG